MKLIKAIGVAAGVMLSMGAMAQQVSTTQSSNPSARPIPESDVLFKKTVWRTAKQYRAAQAALVALDPNGN